MRLGLSEEEQYIKIGKIIQKLEKELDKDLIYNICRWEFPGEWAADIADSWRVGLDIVPEFSSVLYEIDQVQNLYMYSSPGHVNDLDMLQIGNGMNETEEASHFIMWCMMSSPLIIGCDLKNLSEKTLKLLKNEELIAINQDSGGHQAQLLSTIVDESGSPKGQVWKKLLGNNSSERAYAFLNHSDEPLEVQTAFETIMPTQEVKDILNQEILNSSWDENNPFSFTLSPHETRVFKVS